MGNVLKAKVLDGDTMAIEYDAEFCKHASHRKTTCWNLLNDKIWLLNVGLLIKHRAALLRAKANFKPDSPHVFAGNITRVGVNN